MNLVVCFDGLFVICSSSRVQIKDSGLGVLTTKHHHFLADKVSFRVGVLEDITIKRNALIYFLFSGMISVDLSMT